ncbi:periplasmic heavy metal sensor [Thauera sp.]|jgi:Spy/CpxP family protein refolding chaperone|uniref:periplasmic heavy metal sensor n=1 Tax=Thauera sp. TaxID=1905334 RepID=UPI002A367906|nr:periplasmic heavy metal sensor [Thauera sp.]MDX9885547.1 periplasmic heavy metal sensor [Thauera sp.]
MKPASLRLALLLSVALNLGVIGAVTLDRLRPPAAQSKPPLHQVLGLNENQRTRWEAAERPFLQQFDAATAQLENHRAALIEALFADTIDGARIETERVAIAELQQTQQRLIIEQLIAERAILDAQQRAQLARLLRDQPGTQSTVEDLHGR